MAYQNSFLEDKGELKVVMEVKAQDMHTMLEVIL